MTTSTEYPLVTFALFAYNQEAYIRDAVDAALAQDYPNLQVILSDDCSTDATWAVMSELATAYTGPHRITLNRNPANLGSVGLGAHLNRVIEFAQGELLVFAGGDDISHPGRTSALVDLWTAAGRPSGALHSAVQVMDEWGTPLHVLHGRKSFSDLDLTGMVRTGGKGVLGASIAATRDLYRVFGPLDPQTWFEDRSTAFRAFLAGQILYAEDALVDYRVHSKSMTSPHIYTDAAKWTRWIEGTLSVLDQFERDYRRSLHGDRDSKVLRAVEHERAATNRARGLHGAGPIMRAWAAWNYGRDMPVRGRIAFAMECAGWINSTPIRQARKLMSIIR